MRRKVWIWMDNHLNEVYESDKALIPAVGGVVWYEGIRCIVYDIDIDRSESKFNVVLMCRRLDNEDNQEL